VGIHRIIHWFKKPQNILLIVILLFAAFLRVYKIDGYMTFLGDEGRDVLIVYEILHGHFTLLGPTASVGGFFLGPIYYYFMAPFLFLFNYNPVGPAVMVALFGVLTVWFVFKIGKEFFNETTGFIAAFFYSISPLIIAYSRSSWNPNVMPFFTILTLYILYKATYKNSIKLFILCGLLLGILMQLHYLAMFVAVIIALYVAVTGILPVQGVSLFQKISGIMKKYVLIFLGFLIGFSPFLAFEVRHGFQNIKNIFQFIFHSPEVTGRGNYFGTVSNVFFRLFGRLITDFPPPEQVSLQAHLNIAVWYWLTMSLGIASVGYFLWQYSQFKVPSFAKASAGRQSSKFKVLEYTLLLLWFCIGVLLFGFYKKQIYDYYFGFLFPLPFLFIGNFLAFLFHKKIYLKIISFIIFLAITYINIQAIPFRSEPNRQLEQVRTIAKFVLNKTENKPYNFALITGGNSDHAYRYFFTIWGHQPVPILNHDIDPQRKSVTNQLLIVCEKVPCYPLGYSLWEVAGFGRAEIIGKWNVSVVEVYKLRHYTGK